jgi:RecB family endonuclease NucS
MDSTIIGKLERVALREVWKHDDALDLTLINVDRERATGSFSIDLVAEDEGGGTVIIENQLEKSNHDHLGKLITYLTGMGAKAAIWIVSDPRPEHVAAISATTIC